jgi:hypothetical protein
VGRVVDI